MSVTTIDACTVGLCQWATVVRSFGQWRIERESRNGLSALLVASEYVGETRHYRTQGDFHMDVNVPTRTHRSPELDRPTPRRDG